MNNIMNLREQRLKLSNLIIETNYSEVPNLNSEWQEAYDKILELLNLTDEIVDKEYEIGNETYFNFLFNSGRYLISDGSKVPLEAYILSDIVKKYFVTNYKSPLWSSMFDVRLSMPKEDGESNIVEYECKFDIKTRREVLERCSSIWVYENIDLVKEFMEKGEEDPEPELKLLKDIQNLFPKKISALKLKLNI
jgi:hypothetical protein